MKEHLQAGFGRREITPELGVRLGGYGVKERPAEKVNDPLNSTCIVMSDGQTKTAIINADLIAITEEDVHTIRSLAAEKCDIPYDNIVVTAIHNHTAPNTLCIPGWGDHEQKYMDSIIPKIVESILEANANLKPVKMGCGTTQSKVGINRREVQLSGGTDMNWNIHGSYDPTMTVIRFESEEKTEGVIVHYGAHPTAYGTERTVSRDWPGIMADRMETQINAPVMFINGTIGDVGPRTNAIRKNGFSAGVGDGIDSVREVGYRAATDALGVFMNIKTYDDTPTLSVLTEDIVMPYDPPAPLAEAKEKIAEYEPHKDEYGSNMFEYTRWTRVLAIHEKGEENWKKGKAYRQTIVRFGPVALVPFPGELFSSISLRLRAASPFPHTLCSSCSNGYYTYLPDKEGFARGGYEAWMSKAFEGYGFVNDLDDHLINDNLKLLEKLDDQT